MLSSRSVYMDVSNTVNVSDPVAVGHEVQDLITACYPDFDAVRFDEALQDFTRLYRGEYAGFKACDLKYHGMQHVLDVTLAMARLLVGHARSHPPEQHFNTGQVLLGLLAALFHDAGYIRRVRDTRHSNGAAYTRTHVSRSARFIGEYLPGLGLADVVPVCQRLVHFTGYEINPEKIATDSERERLLGNLLGTADLIAQMADVDYLRKCHDYLYAEFEAGGMAGDGGKHSVTGIVYRSAEHLMASTPGFMREAHTVRLDGYFQGVYHYAGVFFGGRNLYMDAIAANSVKLEAMLAGTWSAANSAPHN